MPLRETALGPDSQLAGVQTHHWRPALLAGATRQCEKVGHTLPGGQTGSPVLKGN